MNRYNSSHYGAIGKKEEPMEIESSNVPYYLPNNKSAGNQVTPPTSRMFSNQQNRPPQQLIGGMSQSHNISGNYSSISSNNMNISHGPNSYGQPNRLGQYQQQPSNLNQPSNYLRNNYQSNGYRQSQQYQIPNNW